MVKELEKILKGLYAADNYLREDLDAICDDTMREYAEDALDRVDASIKEAEKLLEEIRMKSNREMACELLRKDGIFLITGVSREDIEHRGFDTSVLSDAQMARFADKMADCYVENYFWDSIDGLACAYDLPVKEISEE